MFPQLDGYWDACACFYRKLRERRRLHILCVLQMYSCELRTTIVATVKMNRRFVTLAKLLKCVIVVFIFELFLCCVFCPIEPTTVRHKFVILAQ